MAALRSRKPLALSITGSGSGTAFVFGTGGSVTDGPADGAGPAGFPCCAEDVDAGGVSMAPRHGGAQRPRFAASAASSAVFLAASSAIPAVANRA